MVVARAMSGHRLNPDLPAHRRHRHHDTDRPPAPPPPHQTETLTRRDEIVFVPRSNPTGTPLHKSCGKDGAQARLPLIVGVYSREAKQLGRHRVRFDDGFIGAITL